MNLKHRLLGHPFYQAWEKGEITESQLSAYASSYSDFISEIPSYWNKVITAFGAEGTEAGKIIKEEKEHTELWKRWSAKLPVNEGYPKMDDVNSAFGKMTPSELLGAIHAFEIQQPEVARTKKDGLLKHYGFDETDTEYFDEHMNEQEHIKFGEYLRENFADRDEFGYGFAEGAKIIFHSLDRFMN